MFIAKEKEADAKQFKKLWHMNNCKYKSSLYQKNTSFFNAKFVKLSIAHWPDINVLCALIQIQHVIVHRFTFYRE